MSLFIYHPVTPAKAGVPLPSQPVAHKRDSRVRGNDGGGAR